MTNLDETDKDLVDPEASRRRRSRLRRSLRARAGHSEPASSADAPQIYCAGTLRSVVAATSGRLALSANTLVTAKALTPQAILFVEALGLDCVDDAGNGGVWVNGHFAAFDGAPTTGSRRGPRPGLHLAGAQGNAFRALIEMKTPVTRTKLADIAGVDRGAVNRLISAVVRGGLACTGEDGLIRVANRTTATLALSEEYRPKLVPLYVEDISAFQVLMAGRWASTHYRPAWPLGAAEFAMLAPSWPPRKGVPSIAVDASLQDANVLVVVPAHNWTFRDNEKRPADVVQRFLDVAAFAPLDYFQLRKCWDETRVWLKQTFGEESV